MAKFVCQGFGGLFFASLFFVFATLPVFGAIQVMQDVILNECFPHQNPNVGPDHPNLCSCTGRCVDTAPDPDVVFSCIKGMKSIDRDDEVIKVCACMCN